MKNYSIAINSSPRNIAKKYKQATISSKSYLSKATSI